MNNLISRRNAVSLLGGAALAPAFSASIIAPANAKGRTLDIRGGSFKPVPIAIAPLSGDPKLKPIAYESYHQQLPPLSLFDAGSHKQLSRKDQQPQCAAAI